MVSLIWKDIIVQKKSWWTVVLYAVFMHVALAQMAAGAYSAGAVGIAYVLIMGAGAYDEKNKTEMLLNSLPLKRRTIVLSKYVSAFIFMLVGMLGSAGAGAIMKVVGLPIPLRFVTWLDVLGMFLGPSFFIGVFFPIFFKLGYTRSRYLNILIFMFFFFTPQYLLGLVRQQPQLFERVSGWLANSNLPFSQLAVLGVCLASFAVLLLSLCLSIAIYQRKEMV